MFMMEMAASVVLDDCAAAVFLPWLQRPFESYI